MNKKDLIKALSSFVSESKAKKIQSIAKLRCHTVQVLLENITDRGNENAITRTMDGMGIHTLHRLHNKENHMMRHTNPTRTDKGSKKWINTHTWFNTKECIEYIKSSGYMLAGTDCTGSSCLDNIDLRGTKVVFGFGSESDGMSQELLDLCDVTFKLPMKGFVSSYNVTVAVAMTLYHMQQLNKVIKNYPNLIHILTTAHHVYV